MHYIFAIFIFAVLNALCILLNITSGPKANTKLSKNQRLRSIMNRIVKVEDTRQS